MINPQKPVINLIKHFNNCTALHTRHIIQIIGFMRSVDSNDNYILIILLANNNILTTTVKEDLLSIFIVVYSDK